MLYFTGIRKLPLQMREWTVPHGNTEDKHMLKHSKRGLQTILFYRFLAISAALLIVISSIVYMIQYSILYKNMENDILRTTTSVGDSIDLQISQMDNICLNVINSTTVKSTFALWQNMDASSYERSKQQNALSNALVSIRGVDSSIRQVNIYPVEGSGYGIGNYYGILPLQAEELPWYTPAIEKNGYRYISSSSNPLLSKKAGTGSDRLYLSLYRMYFDNYHNPMGFVEIVKYYDELFADAISPKTESPVDITVYDSDGNQIYPYLKKDSPEAFDYYTTLEENTSLNGHTRLYNSQKSQKEYVSFSRLDYCGFTVVCSVRNIDFFLPILKSLMWIPLLALSLFVICYFVAGFLSRKLAKPLTEMHQFLSDTDSSEQFRLIHLDDSGIEEIDRLRDSLNASIQAREAATESLLVMKEQEIQAQMLALQAQMNPHFLYNSLNTISAMAEEGMTEEVSGMCQDITSILRYISSDRESVSTVEEELEHCDLYLRCMKKRFKDSFTYEFDIADDLLDMKIPKLCIQLLIENSVKFTSQTAPPWHIRVEGYIDDGQWLISVKDNGPGFDPEVDKHLRSQMDEILKYSVLPSLELDGMGILNIFIRFYLLFGKAFLFQFGNLPERGSFVIVGGRFHEEDQTL